jgi:hypothetical protein
MLDFTSCEFVCAAAHHQFSHNGDDSKYLTEYNARATVPSRFNDTLVTRSLRHDPFGAKWFRNRSISLKNATVLDRLAPNIHAIHFNGRRPERTSPLLTRSGATGRVG